MGDDPPPDLEGDSDELDDCVDEDTFSSTDDGEDVELAWWVRIGWCWQLGRDLSHVMPTPILFI